jgi:hypothetical protein
VTVNFSQNSFSGSRLKFGETAEVNAALLCRRKDRSSERMLASTFEGSGKAQNLLFI